MKQTKTNTKRASVKAQPSHTKGPNDISTYLKQAKKSAFPSQLRPMLATLVDAPFDDEAWQFEVKWDGYRALAMKNKKQVLLKSRNDKSFNEKFYPIYEAVKAWNINAVVDGEIVVVSENGIPNFNDLQNWRSEADGQTLYYVFDMLWVEGKNLTQLPLTERQAILRGNMPPKGIIRLSDTFDTQGIELFNSVRKIGLEGIIAKRKDSLYYPGERTKEWLKIKSNLRQEVIIGGYTNNEGSPKPFSALVVGVFDKGRLQYTGKIGTGFNIRDQEQMMKQFKPLIIKQCPFTFLPDIDKPSRFRPNPPRATVTWLKPQLVCEVSYIEMTSDGVMRHPSFEGMRIDKKASEVKAETPLHTSEVAVEKESSIKQKIIVPLKKERKTLLNPKEETQVKTINGHAIKFTNLSKIYWPQEKVSKRDMLNYYYQVAPYMVPYLKDRPQSLNRHPNGINGESFYQKDVTGKAPDWIETFLYHSDADNRDRNYLVCTDEASLLYMASLGCIEINPWSSRRQSPEHPDWCIIDLDPDKNSFDQVIEAAQVTKDVLDSLKVPGYCKTSGSTGLHIYIPLAAKYTYEESKEFARVIATLVHEQIPKFTSIERQTANRGGKMYVDFLQNRYQATLAAPYSLRPKPGATVSMPLHWEEVKKGLKMKDFNIFNALDRLKSEGDLFKPVLGKGIDMRKALQMLQTM
jgi:bifunctional non-homologous end joining protein LigD